MSASCATIGGRPEGIEKYSLLLSNGNQFSEHFVPLLKLEHPPGLTIELYAYDMSAVPTTTSKRKRSLSPGSNTAEISPAERQVIRRKEDVEDQAVDHANPIIQRRDREKEFTVPTTSGIFDRAHDLDVHNGTFMSAAGNINIYHNSAPHPNSPSDSDIPVQLTTSSSSARSSVIYHRNLIIKRRGSPLWIPEPDDTLPTPYQLKGVSFGDVGLLSPSGSFDFFFNICYPSDDPINSGGVPEGFKPFRLTSLKIRGAREFETTSYVASESIKISRKQYSNSGAADLVFESSAAEGAILTMPNGARSEDLVGTLHLREYVLEHIESWYKLIMCDFGCDVENGDIVVVTGCDKTDSWGVATFIKSSEAVKLTFHPITSSRSYNWEYSGSFDARTGPNLKVIQGLRSSAKETDVSSPESLLNQCIFVRTLTGTLRDDIWESLRRSVSRLDPNRDMHNGQNFLKGDFGPGAFSTPTSSEGSTENGSPMRGGWSGQQRQHIPAFQRPVSFVSNVSTTMMNHPSKLLNQFLWKNLGHKYPSARVVMTEDRDWIAVLRDNDRNLPDTKELYRRIMEHTVVMAESPGDEFLNLSFLSRSLGDNLHSDAALVVHPSSSSSHPSPSQRHHTPVQYQSSNDLDPVNGPTLQAQNPGSAENSSRASAPSHGWQALMIEPGVKPLHSSKIRVACNSCRRMKLRCDGGQPICASCLRRGSPCDYVPLHKRRGTQKPGHNNGSGSEIGEERTPEQDRLSLSPEIPPQAPSPRSSIVGSLPLYPDPPLPLSESIPFASAMRRRREGSTVASSSRQELDTLPTTGSKVVK
ncbi:hypothetical protein D9613_004569 [Agrocybe pediades]|uniref:Zn(2)-C6 fungal-type domain-containing protein n=1 Tax=Agrocybe pediades TaxID=84607 RepID=A0A8H4QK37_9AGAR|nr:hypothetical protein D9613_004569 [Agrocybe pediades]